MVQIWSRNTPESGVKETRLLHRVGRKGSISPALCNPLAARDTNLENPASLEQSHAGLESGWQISAFPRTLRFWFLSRDVGVCVALSLGAR